MNMPLITAIGGGAVVAAAAAAVLALLLPNGPLRQAPPQSAAQPGAEPLQATAATEPQTKHEDFADWALICTAGAESQSCAIVQNHVHGETRQRLFTVQLQRVSGEALSASLLTPLQVHLRQGIILQVDDLEPVRIAYSECRPTLCQATARLTNDFVDRLVRAQDARAAYHTSGGQTVTINISVTGLGDALAALERGAGQ
jgi:invasion protein IalB